MLLSAERGTGSLQDSSPPLHTLGKELIHLHVGASSTTAVMSKTQRGASPASSLHGTRSRRQLGEAGTGVAQPGGGGREGGRHVRDLSSILVFRSGFGDGEPPAAGLNGRTQAIRGLGGLGGGIYFKSLRLVPPVIY